MIYYPLYTRVARIYRAIKFCKYNVTHHGTHQTLIQTGQMARNAKLPNPRFPTQRFIQ